MRGHSFGLEGPVMQGTWYNPKNGDTFTVRDTFFEDNQLVVQTTTGRMINQTQLQDYIQQSGTGDLGMGTPTPDPVPQEILDMIEPVREKHIKPAEYHVQPDLENTRPEVGYSNNRNYDIINRALSKLPLPKIKVDLKWDAYPGREIEMLKDIMDVPIDDITEWYNMKFDLQYIQRELRKCIQQELQQCTQRESNQTETKTTDNEPTIDKSERKTGRSKKV